MTATAVQPSFDDLGTPLYDVTFCVVDLETTGTGSADAITEIGAVKVRGGENLGELSTLVRPGSHILASVQLLTGITDQMVAGAPTMPQVLPSWLEFSRGTVLVAHNARFDIGFLKRACAADERPWPGNTVVDTLALARSCLHRDEVNDFKLGTLARHFHAATSPTHRALDDARATVDVLHGILERVGNLGVTTLEDLLEVTHAVPAARRSKRVWADGLPEGPGVYWFVSERRSSSPEVLYVGTSVNVRRRVRQYFTASETRRRMDEMVRVSTGVRAQACATTLEAGVRELRLINAHQPRYNRRSRRQDGVVWVTLTEERHPRLSVVRDAGRRGRLYWGPFTGRGQAEEACRGLRELTGVRECTGSAASHPHGCPLAEMGRCAAPCLHPESSAHRDAVELARIAMTVDLRLLVARAADRITALSRAERFEEAAEVRERADLVLRATRRRARIAALADCEEIVAARPSSDSARRRSWEIHVVRHGRLAGAALSPAGVDPMPTIDAVRREAETVPAGPSGVPACSVEEAELVASWLEEPGVRLVEVTGEWSWPAHCAVLDEELARQVAGRLEV
jgi:DNA polymerase-3 subunit epsilon